VEHTLPYLVGGAKTFQMPPRKKKRLVDGSPQLTTRTAWGLPHVGACRMPTSFFI